MIARFPIPLLLTFLLASLAGAQTDTPPAPRTPAHLEAQIKSLLPELTAATVSIWNGQGSGSGVIVSPDGLILTAAHVITKPGTKLRFLLADGRELTGTALGLDHTTDAGLARIDSPGPFPYCPYIGEKTYQTGDWVLALGHPGGPHIGRPSPVRLGRINLDGTKSGFADPISTTAFVISGDSGGPLFDLDGRVIGINSNISGDWETNNHVPLPAFLAVWDRLLNREDVSGDPDQPDAPSYDDPFRFQREYFFGELAKRPGDPAAHLLARPRLLDPHHTQQHLDRWASESADSESPFDPDDYHTGIPPQPAQPPVARLGLRFDLRAPGVLVSEVLPGSPAERAGLAPGDRILSLGGQAVTDTPAFARALRKTPLDPEQPPALALRVRRAGQAEPLDISVTPGIVPARRYFRQPLSVLSAMMSGAAAVPLSERLRSLRDAFAAELPKTAPDVLAITRDGHPLILATAISPDGDCLTKASEITTTSGDLLENLQAEHRGSQHPVTLLATDPVHDLALIHIPVRGLTPARWSDAPPPDTGTLVIAPQPGTADPVVGIVTQPVRPAPKVGFDHILILGETPPFLGVTLARQALDEKHPTVTLVEPGSPAESAGFLEGDIITTAGGEDISSQEALLKQIRELQPGEKFTLTVRRGDRKIDISPILGTRTTNTRRSSPIAIRLDQALHQLSARGGKLSRRRQGFPRALYHDTNLQAHTCGGPLTGLDGQPVGFNIARSLRNRALAIPSASVRQSIQKLRKLAPSPDPARQ